MLLACWTSWLQGARAAPHNMSAKLAAEPFRRLVVPCFASRLLPTTHQRAAPPTQIHLRTNPRMTLSMLLTPRPSAVQEDVAHPQGAKAQLPAGRQLQAHQMVHQLWSRLGRNALQDQPAPAQLLLLPP